MRKVKEVTTDTEHIDDGTAYDDDGEATAAVCDTIERHLSEVETALG